MFLTTHAHKELYNFRAKKAHPNFFLPPGGELVSPSLPYLPHAGNAWLSADFEILALNSVNFVLVNPDIIGAQLLSTARSGC